MKTLTTLDLNKITPYAVGFDRIISDMFQYAENNVASTGYPPYNIRKLNELQYVVELALAGFSKSDIEVEVTDGTLTIRSAIAKDDGGDNDETSENNEIEVKSYIRRNRTNS